ncbi:MAG TPA: lysophospholipid acyltransferase family protein [Blastocatellia bacterium]|nr:lysophospholipid acyltransferase family protein [Blastocatellia bacterium]
MRPLCAAWSNFCYRLEFVGVENVPVDGPVIFTPNHVTYLDPMWISLPIERRIYYMAWDALFRFGPISNLLRAFGAFPVRLEGHDKGAMREARCHLASGRALMIFPEGGRTTTGKLMPFKAGAFRLALFSGASVVPVTIADAHDIWPAGKIIPRPFGRIRIIYHPPIPVVARGAETDATEIRHLARELADSARDVVASALDPSRVGGRTPPPQKPLAVP